MGGAACVGELQFAMNLFRSVLCSAVADDTVMADKLALAECTMIIEYAGCEFSSTLVVNDHIDLLYQEMHREIMILQ